MMTFRKLSADGAGKLIMAYLREHQMDAEPGAEVSVDGSQENGGRLNNYYTGREGRGDWGPGIGPLAARALGIDLSAPPTDEALCNLFEAKRADTGEEWHDIEGDKTAKQAGRKAGGRKRSISGFDFTASPDKSVTLAAEFASTKAEQALIWHAIHTANDRALGLIAAELGWARRMVDGVQLEEQGEVGWVSFRHYAARPAMQIQDGASGPTASVEIPVPGDPQAHIHNILLNMVATADGHVGSLDSARMTKTAPHIFGAYFQAQLAQLLRELGIKVSVDARGRAIVIDDIPKEVCEAFSKRSKQAEKQAKAFVARQGGDWNTMSADQKFKVLHQANLAYRAKKYTGSNDREIWREQAEELGWKHTTSLTDAVYATKTDAERFEEAYVIAAHLVAEDFKSSAVLDLDVLRMHAAHGLIAAGIHEADDMDHVRDMILQRGVVLEGEQTDLVVETLHGRERVTSKFQISVEKEFSELVALAARNTDGALAREALQKAIEASGLDFDREPDHGRAQLAAIYGLGLSGRLGFLTGAAGAGKTALLSPLVTAWKEEGRQVIGTAMAWRQADALKDAGVERTVALSPLLREIENGRLAIAPNSVLIIDEGSQIAPIQMLKLLRLQKEVGFSMRIIADREQAQAIEAGDSVELMMRSVPAGVRFELLSTIRQKTERGRMIAGLFRGTGRDTTKSEEEQNAEDTLRARKAIDLKRADGTFSLVGGDHAQVVSAIAEFYLKRRDMLLAAGSKRGITMSAPTNEDVMALSVAVRERLRERGEVGKEEIVRAAIDQRGETYDLPIAVGDRLRLFSKVRCLAQRSYGPRWLELGSNGDFVDVLDWTDKGLILRNRTGTEGMVPWDSLADRQTGRIALGFGHAMTIDAAQGATSDEHINALPRGSSSMTGFTAYVAESRHVHASWTMVGEASVREAEMFSRPVGDTTPVTYEDMLNRIAGDMGKHPYKSVAIDLSGEEMKVRQGQIEWIRSERDREDIEETEQQPGERARSRAISVSLRKVPIERWDDLGRNLRRKALIAQDAAERANRRVAQMGIEKNMFQDRTQTPTPHGSKARAVRPSTEMGVGHE